MTKLYAVTCNGSDAQRFSFNQTTDQPSSTDTLYNLTPANAAGQCLDVQESMTAVVLIDDHHLAAAGRDVDTAPGLSLDDYGQVTGSAAQVRKHGEDAMMVVRGGGGSGLVYVAS